MKKTPSSEKIAAINIVRMSLADVNHPHPKNPREIPPPDSEEIRVLDASLAHDYFDPVVWNSRNGLLVSGHVRVPRLIALGFTHADVSVVDYDDATHEARLLAGNDHSGRNDDDKLATLITSLRESQVDPVLAMLSAFKDDSSPKKSRGKPPPTSICEVFEIILECNNEAQQAELFDRFRREGLKCRLLTL